MLKKCLFAIAVTALLAVTVQAGSIKYKGDPYPWPVEWQEVTVCEIDVYMEVGFWVEIKGCDDDILLKQVPCADIGKGSGDYPCYAGCTDLEIRTNFEAELSGKLADKELDMKTKQKFNGDEDLILPGDGEWIDVEACVAAYKVELWDLDAGASAGSKQKVGILEVNVVPTLDIDDIYPPMP